MAPVTDAQAVLAHVHSLPPLPAAIQRLLMLTSLPPERADLGEIARVITHEPALAALALKWVNSPLYGVRVEVRNVHQAVSLMGLRIIRSMVLGSEVNKMSSNGLYGYGMSSAMFSQHGMATATACQRLAERHLPGLRDDAFTLGLLHDIGMLLLDPLVKEHKGRYQEGLQAGMAQEEVEQDLFGVDHCALGASILEAWNLPQDTSEQIALHHAPLADSTPAILAVLKVADSLTEVPFAERLGHSTTPDVAACRALGVTPEDLQSLEAHLEASMEGAASLFSG
jgi:HD-like signal output (HDOD) protein